MSGLRLGRLTPTVRPPSRRSELLFSRLLKTFLLALLIGPSVFAKQPKVKITGTFSSLEYNQEGGDLNGVEIFIFFAGEHMVLFQESVGEPVAPSLVRAKVNGDSVEFTVPGLGGGKRTFTGKISKTHLVGKFSGAKEQLKLLRRSSYWQ